MQLKTTLTLVALSLCSLMLQAGEYLNFNHDWKFTKGNPQGAQTVELNDASWQSVLLPHDWAILEPFDANGDGNTGKLPWKADGWYRKHFIISDDVAAKHVSLIFDGVMSSPVVYINGQKAGSWDYGYNSFVVDITNLMHAGNNVVAVYVDNRQHDSRWYPGAGIYRKVTMQVSDLLSVDTWGTYITTPVVSKESTELVIRTNVNNFYKDNQEVEVESAVIDAAGVEKAKVATTFTIRGEGKHDLEQKATLKDAVLWDLQNPYLYTLKTTVRHKGVVTDVNTTSFGVRTMEFTANDGFYLNGKRVWLKGVNLHHDQGALGAKLLPCALQRQLEIMKGMGCNAIRTSHNMAAPELLELCDKMGFVVVNEAFDKYDQKIDLMPGVDFKEYAQRNIHNFVVRDRNHPCIALWSVGNEMGDVQWNINGGFDKLNTMINLVRQFDSSRPVTMVCDNRNSIAMRHFDYYDVHSWNYGHKYVQAHQADSTKGAIISESASTVSTRGFYDFALSKDKSQLKNANQVTSYDTYAPEWAEISDADFAWLEDDHFASGEFVWTGFDYLGEPTPFDPYGVKQGNVSTEQIARSSFFGIVDLAGLPKDRYYLYRSHWLPDSTTVHILPHWNWQGMEGKTIPVFVYTNGDEAELFVNGQSQGRRKKEPHSADYMKRYRLMWNEVTYQPGEVKAVAYKNSIKIGEEIIRTAGKPSQLRLVADRQKMKADGDDLIYMTVDATDAKGNYCPTTDNTVIFTVEGAAVIEAVDNGNPQSLEPFASNKVKLFNGKAIVILRSVEGRSGNIKVTATSAGLKSGKITGVAY